MKISALIPAKGFSDAKHRLSPLLGPSERQLLAQAMLRDVLSQVVSAQGLEATFVVTGNDRVSEIARSLGAEVIQEKEERGETEAVLFAFAELKQRGIQTVLVMPGDIPLVRSTDIEQILQPLSAGRLTPPFALLVPSHDRLGTNGLLLSPPDVIRLRFGYDSFSYHLSEVVAKGLPRLVLENDRIALDIDEPKDLKRLLEIVVRDCESCSVDEQDNQAQTRIAGGETYGQVIGLGILDSFLTAHRSGAL